MSARRTTAGRTWTPLAATVPPARAAERPCCSLSLPPLPVARSRDRAHCRDLGGASDHPVDESVVLRLVRGEPPVPVGVVLDLLDGRAGFHRKAPGKGPFQ